MYNDNLLHIGKYLPTIKYHFLLKHFPYIKNKRNIDNDFYKILVSRVRYDDNNLSISSVYLNPKLCSIIHHEGVDKCETKKCISCVCDNGYYEGILHGDNEHNYTCICFNNDNPKLIELYEKYENDRNFVEKNKDLYSYKLVKIPMILYNYRRNKIMKKKKRNCSGMDDKVIEQLKKEYLYWKYGDEGNKFAVSIFNSFDDRVKAHLREC
jgi:hypothetical protein